MTLTPDLPKTSWKRTRPFQLGDLEVLPSSGELRYVSRSTPTGALPRLKISLKSLSGRTFRSS